MKYFTLLPKITSGLDIYINLNWKIKFQVEIDNSFVMTYRVQENESLESICNDFYNDSSLWWILAIINDFRDIIFEMPLNEEVIQAMAKNLSTINGNINTELYLTNYDLLSIENDAKRSIKIIKPEMLQGIVREFVKQQA